LGDTILQVFLKFIY